MQDRFKFRTWNIDIKYFTYWGWVKNSEYRNMCSCREMSKDELLEKYTQQCTGLKDKNSKLIYEGDICKYKFEEIGEQKAIIYFNKELCSFLAKPLNDFQYIRINDCEVIGNIYENPELLEVENE